ncbi:cupredoxin domain-containing protein [Fundidesulfovibrio terrae]|uniref:cupredoxin domain-containing protein n=1 Tax=Fundidesulfovibrio terrae TaxID=2922866 RepID=UPI001FB02739|nr:cupredoxin domain-containing protein [Fundidesulfovibrio terrae]
MRGITIPLLVALLFAVCTVAMTASPALAQQDEQVVTVTAKQYEFSPQTITVKKGTPVVLELTSLDRLHGFSCPALKLRSDIPPGKTTTVRFVPDKVGTFPFHCDNFCGSGHEHMIGTITVTE